MPKMRLSWARDCDGYRIEPAAPAKSGRRRSTIAEGENGSPATVTGNSGKAREYDALSIDGLYRQLAAVKDDDSVLAFVDKFGLLDAGNRANVESLMQSAAVMRSLIDARKRRDWPVLSDWLDKYASVIRLTGERLPGKRPELFFRPRTLHDAIYLQFFEDTAGGAKLKLCERPGCGNWFKYGSGTGRRKTAHYCSPKCHKAHAYEQKVQS